MNFNEKSCITTLFDPSALDKMTLALEPVRVYRRSLLAQVSYAVDRRLKALVDTGAREKLASGITMRRKSEHLASCHLRTQS